MKYVIDISESIYEDVKKYGIITAIHRNPLSRALQSARPLTEITTEIEELANFHSLKIPLVYGDGERTMDRAILLGELAQVLFMFTDEDEALESDGSSKILNGFIKGGE